MNPMKKILLLFMMAYPLAVAAQKQITIDDFTVKNTFAQKSVNGINWMKNGKFYTSIKENAVVRFDITTGLPTDTIVDGADLSPKLTIHDYSFSQDEKKLLLVTEFESIYRRSFKAEYFVYDIEKKSLAPLSKNGKQSYATFSPQGNNVAFVRGNNLFNVNLADLSETQITTDGKFNFIINGSSDWVYEEEFGFAQAFYWSPDGKKLAYYRFDETNVREYNLQKWNKGQLYPGQHPALIDTETWTAVQDQLAVKARRHRPIFMVDLAVPRDIEPEVGQLEDVFLYTVDDLGAIVREGNASRQAAVAQAETIIETRVQNFMQWLDARSIVPVIRHMHTQADALRRAEVEKAQKMLARGDDPTAVLEALSQALTNKLIHGPTHALNRASSENRDQLIELMGGFYKHAHSSSER